MNTLADNYVITEHDAMLVNLRDGLYEGSWRNMLIDLEQRLTRRPYIHKLVQNINADIPKIKKLQEYELKTRKNLSDCLKE